MTHCFNNSLTCRNETTVYSKSLAKGSDNDIRLSIAVFRGSSPGFAVRADTVRVIHNCYDTVSKPGFIAGCNGVDLINWCCVTAHGIDTVKDNDYPFDVGGNLIQAAAQIIHVVMFENALIGTWNSGNTHSSDD